MSHLHLCGRVIKIYPISILKGRRVPLEQSRISRFGCLDECFIISVCRTGSRMVFISNIIKPRLIFRVQFSRQIQADHDEVRLNSDRFTSATCRRKRLFPNLISINMFDKNFIGCSFAAFSANLLFSFRFKAETLIAGTD